MEAENTVTKVVGSLLHGSVVIEGGGGRGRRERERKGEGGEGVGGGGKGRRREGEGWGRTMSGPRGQPRLYVLGRRR